MQNVPTVDVNIVVVANLVLDPPELYLLPGTIVPLRLSQIRQGKAEVISLPSSQYFLEADDPKVSATVDNTGSIRVKIHTHQLIRMHLIRSHYVALFLTTGFGTRIYSRPLT